MALPFGFYLTIIEDDNKYDPGVAYSLLHNRYLVVWEDENDFRALGPDQRHAQQE
jgi:hypothetical protein